jgi:hypothetical protein
MNPKKKLRRYRFSFSIHAFDLPICRFTHSFAYIPVLPVYPRKLFLVQATPPRANGIERGVILGAETKFQRPKMVTLSLACF